MSPGARCFTTTEHRPSFVVIRTLTLLKLSSISNCRTLVTLVYACRYLLCVCVCVRACGIKDVCELEMRYYFFANSTHQCMYQYIVQSSVTSKTTHNLSHIDTTTTIQTIANTIMSTKLTDDTLQRFIVKSPVSTMSIHIAFKIGTGSTSERIEIFSATVFHADGRPMTTGSVLQTSRRGQSGRLSTLKTPSKSLAHCRRRMRSISFVFILQSRRRRSCCDPPQ